MKHPDALRWNQRYSNEGVSWAASQPRPFLVKHAHLLPHTGLALDAAAGVVTNGLFLARRGIQVIAMDISEVGLRIGLEQSRQEGLMLEAAVFDLRHPWFPAACFDVVLNCRYLERAALHQYRTAIKPAGLLFFEGFVNDDPVLDRPHHYLEPGELRSTFQGWETIHWALNRTSGTRRHPARTMEQLIARKPL